MALAGPRAHAATTIVFNSQLKIDSSTGKAGKRYVRILGEATVK